MVAILAVAVSAGVLAVVSGWAVLARRRREAVRWLSEFDAEGSDVRAAYDRAMRTGRWPAATEPETVRILDRSAA